ncbi:MAG: hypothetical protein OXQ28_08240 [Acidobacteriota bacterium]|nr:hypothetical protein [Acidobacteriota bacterium]
MRPWGFVRLDEAARGSENPAKTMLEKMREHTRLMCSSGTNLEEQVLPLLGNDSPRWKPPDHGTE